MLDEAFMQSFSYLAVIDRFDKRLTQSSAGFHFFQTSLVVLSFLGAFVKIFFGMLLRSNCVRAIEAPILIAAMNTSYISLPADGSLFGWPAVAMLIG